MSICHCIVNFIITVFMLWQLSTTGLYYLLFFLLIVPNLSASRCSMFALQTRAAYLLLRVSIGHSRYALSASRKRVVIYYIINLASSGSLYAFVEVRYACAFSKVSHGMRLPYCCILSMTCTSVEISL